MKRRLLVILIVIAALLFAAFLILRPRASALPVEAVMGPKPTIVDPHTERLPTMNVAKAIGWKQGEAPTPAAGLAVNAFAANLDHPRNILVLPNGDVLVAESNSPPRKGGGVRGWVMRLLMKEAGAGGASPNRIILLRDADGDGVAETRSVLLAGLNSPYGMALVGGHLYVGDTDAVLRFPFKPGQTRIDAKGEKVIALPGGGSHWVRNLLASEDGTRLYVSVGSSTNIAENGLPAEEGRAQIREIDLKSGSQRIFAAGLRNPVGMAWEPVAKSLWTVVNERDMIGPDVPPDYLTEVEFGGNYGWPFYYWHGYVDKRVPQPEVDQREYMSRPDYALGPHTASLGLAFASGTKLGARFAEGAFIGQHGSWNRKPRSGYKVIFVPFAKGKPEGMPIDVLTGFLDRDEQARGRPVGVAIDGKGALLVADDVGNRIWRVSAKAAGAPVR